MGRRLRRARLADLRHLQRTQITVEVSGDPYDLSAVAGIEDLEVSGGAASFSVDPA